MMKTCFLLNAPARGGLFKVVGMHLVTLRACNCPSESRSFK
ncbi:hypothetical protein LMG19083_02174 [Ralstonia psammae]|uniref:Uncharacterized protein n=1 Tax=Ralstonia psammae TaxID=3058598 RepID=A0ABM9JF57_9RALS|nr:hypothetical protein LMG19083_02174 [Ralstonia sp. LMG 19083]